MDTIQEVVANFSTFSGSALKSRSFEISFPDLRSLVESRGRKLLKLGLNSTDRVLLLASNSPEWFIWSLAINWAGLVDVPRGEYTTSSEVEFIAVHSGATAVVVQNRHYLNLITDDVRSRLEHIIGMRPLKGTIDLDSMPESDRIPAPAPPRAINSIIYTSGTTGDLKGVELTNENFLSNAKALLHRIQIGSDDLIMSVLPAWHVYERIIKYGAAIKGVPTFYSSPRELIKDIQAANPTIMGTVPRLWELIYNKIQRKLAGRGVAARFKRMLINRAVQYKIYGRKNCFMCGFIARKLVFPKIRKIFGSRFKYAISGGGALPRHIEDLFSTAGVTILEGYGLTETSPVIAVRSPDNPKAHTVGKPLSNLQVKIINMRTGNEQSSNEEGLIYVKGPSVTPGYYHDYVMTSKVMHDGFFNTGDLGCLDEQGFLKVTGRYKQLIVLSSGENIQPLKFENALSESPYIELAILIGQNWKGIGALLVPDFEALQEYCKRKKITYDRSRLPEILQHQQVIELYQQEVNRLINSRQDTKSYERIKAFDLLPNSFEVGRELTATMKPRRHIISKIYQSNCNKVNKAINGTLVV
ncbi:long-chain fatty acid--CoA ligase [Lentisphaerota bacterium ZTH]|nr:long-chain fatty acid--CoA ligase [Lentisphaerota bacterium]WET06157.1 long-chain fatty acid--CoA ligase [Lentisphaerota bacterium ZTH]